MLRIPVRKKWWKMEYDGQKPEDYREIGDYWRKRFESLGLLDAEGKPIKGAVADVILVNGYGPKAPELLPPGDGAPGLCLLGRSVSSHGPGGLRLSLLKLASAGPADMEVCCSKEAQQRVACFLEEQVV